MEIRKYSLYHLQGEMPQGMHGMTVAEGIGNQVKRHFWRFKPESLPGPYNLRGLRMDKAGTALIVTHQGTDQVLDVWLADTEETKIPIGVRNEFIRELHLPEGFRATRQEDLRYITLPALKPPRLPLQAFEIFAKVRVS